MDGSTTICVVIPAYNAAAFLAETVASVLAARDVMVRVVIVDDGSQDETAAVARRLEADHANVVLIAKANGGVSSARNAGIGEADRYVCFLDADDLLAPDGLSHLLRALQADSGAVAAYGKVGHLRESGERTPPRAALLRQSGDISATVLRGNLVDTPGAMLFCADAIRQVGGFLNRIRIGEDWNLYARVAQLGAVVFVDETVMWYRLHVGSVMGRGRQSLSDFRATLDATYGDTLIRSRHTVDVLAKSRLEREIGLASYLVQRSRAVSEVAAAVVELVHADGFVRYGGLTHRRFWRLLGMSVKAFCRVAR